MELNYLSTATVGDLFLDQDIRDLQVLVTPDGVFLSVINGVNGGVTVYALSASGLTYVDHALHDGATLLMGEVVALGADQARIILEGTLDGTLQQYRLMPDGSLAAMEHTALPSDDDAGLRELAVLELSEDQVALYAVTAEGVLAGWRFETFFDSAQEIEITPAISLDPSASLEVVSASGASVILVAEGDIGQLTSYTVDPVTGGVRQADQFGAAEGLAVATPTDLLTFYAHDTHWAIMAASGSHSLTMFSISDGGEIGFVEQVLDTAITRFQSVTAVAQIEVHGQVYIFAAGADDGLSLMQMLPDGRLVHLQTLVHEVGQGLENVTALEVVEDGGYLHVYANSQTEAGVAQYRVSLTEIGAFFEADGSASVIGSGADDLLYGSVSESSLIGGAGDDVLVSRAAGDALTGGAGDDLFVLHDVEGEITITDFEPGDDRIDLSFFPGLKSPDQLRFVSAAHGAILMFEDTTIEVFSASGSPLTFDDIWPDGFVDLDRVPLGDVSDDGVVYGSGVGDTLIGTSLSDQIEAQSGDDEIMGFSGDDSLSGGDGDDVVMGDEGADRLSGGSGADELYGGSGNDHIFGDAGDDIINGNEGIDDIWGGAGDDYVRGRAGDDAIWGGDGHDELRGGADQDLLYGGDGADLIKGNGGNDTIYGNAGFDTLKGGRGDDYIEGESWDDLLKGKRGDDTLVGGADDDTLKGNDGDDLLNGGSDNDLLDGGAGDDVLWGDEGADVFKFAKFHGSDCIGDFTPGEDIIDLRNLFKGGAKRFDDLTITTVGEDLLIDTGKGEIWLTGLGSYDISGADFWF